MAGLEDKAKIRVETFSGGMKRRINIAAGILHRPQVLLMDEPTVGIDPQSRNHILDTVRELNREGMTVVYTSHYMEEVEALCDRIAIVDHGRVIALGTLEELRALVGDEDRIRIALDDGAPAPQSGEPDAEQTPDSEDPAVVHSPQALAALEAVRALDGVSRAEFLGSTLEVLVPDAAVVLGAVVEAIGRSGAHLRSVEVVEPDLESVFLHLTGRGLRD
jgi:ABC-2 type transport system ATP-binding protein